MSTLAAKRKLLEDAGYTYNFKRKIYLNKSDKKVFSIEFIDDNNESRLEECIKEKNNSNQWRFYFSIDPSESVRQALQRELDS